MEYRQLPHGTEREKFGVLGLGLGGIGKTPADEIEAIIRKALDHGINYFDLCTAGATYAPFGRAIAGKRDRVFIQVHLKTANTAGAGILTPSKRPSCGNWKRWGRIMPTLASCIAWMRMRILTSWWRSACWTT